MLCLSSWCKRQRRGSTWRSCECNRHRVACWEAWSGDRLMARSVRVLHRTAPMQWMLLLLLLLLRWGWRERRSIRVRLPCPAHARCLLFPRLHVDPSDDSLVPLWSQYRRRGCHIFRWKLDSFRFQTVVSLAELAQRRGARTRECDAPVVDHAERGRKQEEEKRQQPISQPFIHSSAPPSVCALLLADLSAKSCTDGGSFLSTATSLIVLSRSDLASCAWNAPWQFFTRQSSRGRARNCARPKCDLDFSRLFSSLIASRPSSLLALTVSANCRFPATSLSGRFCSQAISVSEQSQRIV